MRTLALEGRRWYSEHELDRRRLLRLQVGGRDGDLREQARVVVHRREQFHVEVLLALVEELHGHAVDGDGAQHRLDVGITQVV